MPPPEKVAQRRFEGYHLHARGVRSAVTVVHHGTRKRRQYIDIPPALLQMNPGMKDYAEIDTPVIKTATERTRVTITVQRR